MMFKMELIGNVCKTPETKTVSSGKTVTYFDVAVNTKPETSEFVQINAWGKLGESCAKYLAKGRKVAVSGELQARLYDARNGQQRLALDVQADEVEFLTPAENAEAKPAKKSKENSDGYDKTAEDELTAFSGDLPF